MIDLEAKIVEEQNKKTLCDELKFNPQNKNPKSLQLSIDKKAVSSSPYQETPSKATDKASNFAAKKSP